MAGRTSNSVAGAGPATCCGCAGPPAGRRAGRYLPLLPPLILAVLPKCPLCLAAWLGLLGSLGAHPWAFRLYGAPLTLALLGIAVLALAVRAAARRDVRPLLLGSLGAAAAAVGRCALETPSLTYAGLALLSAAVVWGNLPRPRPAARRAPENTIRGGHA